ncbi:MAG: TIGR01777 family oxidoreductase [Allomuricauda sp.]
MKVLITGATGLVGQAIVKMLHAEGASVNYLTTGRKKVVSSENFTGFYWNPTKGEIDLDCFQNVDAIINLAGTHIAKRWTSAHKKRVLNSRLDSLKTLRKAMEQVDTTHIRSFISASAIGVYPSSLTHYYDEQETEVDDSFIGEVVRQWEKCTDSFNDFHFNVSKIRIGIVLSSEGGALPRMARPIKNFVGAPLGSGNQWQSWIHIDDLARMFVFVLENNLKGTYNGVSPNPVTNAKMTKELAKVLDRPLVLPNVPRFALRAILGEMSYLLFASQRVSSKKIEKKGFNFEYPNICRALEDLCSDRKKKDESSVASLNNEFV